MEINLVPPAPISLDRASTSNVIQPGTEAHVQRELRQTPVPPVAELQTQTHGNDSSAERKLVWVPEEKRPVYRVIDSKTGKVVCQLPSEEVLRVTHRIVAELEKDEDHRDVDHGEIDVRS